MRDLTCWMIWKAPIHRVRELVVHDAMCRQSASFIGGGGGGGGGGMGSGMEENKASEHLPILLDVLLQKAEETARN